MVLNEVLFPLLFLSVFQLFGGTALGLGLRSTLSEGAGASLFFIIWGAGFGGIPTFIGVVLMLAEGAPRLALIPPVVFASAVLCAFALWHPMTKAFGVGTTIGVGLGGALLLAGVLLAVLALGQRGGTPFTVLGGVLFLIGGTLAALSASSILRTRLDNPGR